MLRAAGEIPGALFRFHCQDNNGQRYMRQWPLAVAARPHRCRNQLHAAILGTSRGSSNRRRRRWRKRMSMSIRKKDIVCCNIVMTLTMATDTHRTARTGGHPLMRTLMKHSTMQIAISCRKKQQQQQRADNCNGVEQVCEGQDRSVQKDNASHVTNTCPATAKCN